MSTTTVAAVRPGWLPVVLACLRRDFAIARSYRLPFVMQAVATAVTLVLFFYVGELVDTSVDGELALVGGSYFGFVVVGIALLRIVQTAMTTFTASIRLEQTTGTLEALLSTAATPSQVILGSATYSLLEATVTSSAMVLAAVPAGLDIRTTIPGAAAAVAALGGLLVLFAALGIAIAAFTVVFKQPGSLTTLIVTGLSILGGVYFPVDLLPGPVRAVASALPFTWGVDVVRDALLGGEVQAAHLVGLVVSAVLTLPAALLLFRRAVGAAARRGSLGAY